jgi:hypothetical protein
MKAVILSAAKDLRCLAEPRRFFAALRMTGRPGLPKNLATPNVFDRRLSVEYFDQLPRFDTAAGHRHQETSFANREGNSPGERENVENEGDAT